MEKLKHFGSQRDEDSNSKPNNKSMDFMFFPLFDGRPASRNESRLTRRSTKVAPSEYTTSEDTLSEASVTSNAPALAHSVSRENTRGSLLSYTSSGWKINKRLVLLLFLVLLLGALLLACVVWFAYIGNRNECLSSPCQSGATCFDQWDSFSCNCAPGYSGYSCDVEIDECLSLPCANNGTCVDFPGHYLCTCPSGYTGAECQDEIDECFSNPCANNGTCLDSLNHYDCQCAPGFSGTFCDTDIDECASAPCHGGTCIDRIDSYLCVCEDGFTGITCNETIDECLSNPCVSGATCIDDDNKYLCLCTDGTYGDLCQYRYSDMYECCSDPCQNNATCAQSQGGYRCHCAPGYEGVHCSVNVDECLSNPCENNATCKDSINMFECACVPGYTGRRCQDEIDECWNNPCQHLGSCLDALNSFVCQCPDGFTGLTCETDMDECASTPCVDGTCVNQVGVFLCFCEPGYTGLLCETEVNECSSNPCLNGAACTDDINRFDCACAQGYYGQFCQYRYSDMYDCCSSPCLNGGTCEERVEGGYVCYCPPGASGVHCENTGDDIILYIDTTGTMRTNENNFYDFCNNVFSALTISEASTRIALITYGNGYDLITHWDLVSATSFDFASIMAGIDALDCTGNGLDQWVGFEAAYNMLMTQDRETTPNFVIYISDGTESADNSEWVIANLEPIADILVIGRETDNWDTLSQFSSNADHWLYYKEWQTVIDIITA